MRFMKCKLMVIIILLLFIFIDSVDAQKGCCSWHGGVSGCSSSGRIICNDGSYSPSCTCTPTYNYGCMDQSANNYNSNANKDDGSCTYDVYGCLNSNATNYNYNANKSDGSCLFEKIVTEEVEINYTSDYRENTTLEYNEQKIVQKGIKGSKEIFYKVITNENGVEVSRDVFKEEVIKEPVDEIIYVGAEKANTFVDQSGAVVAYKQVISGSGTAYTAPAGALTATGVAAYHGGVAVNPNIIPYGSKLYITSTD